MNRVTLVLLCTLVACVAMAGDNVVLHEETFDGVEALVRFPPAENRGFSIIDVPAVREGDNILSYWDPKRHDLVINGAYFNPDFTPTGYCRIDRRVITPHVSPALSGFVAIDEQGRLSLLTAADDLERYPTVLQTGPYVIDPGGRVGIKSRSGKAARRTLLGRTVDDHLVVLITEPLYLFELARIARQRFPELERLLNLDGGPSTAIKTRAHEVINVLPVRNYIVKAAGSSI